MDDLYSENTNKNTALPDAFVYHIIDLDDPLLTYGNIIYGINQKFPFTGELKIVIYCLHPESVDNIKFTEIINYIKELIDDDSLNVSVAYRGSITLTILPQLYMIKDHLEVHHNSSFYYINAHIGDYMDHIVGTLDDEDRKRYISDFVNCYKQFWQYRSVNTITTLSVILTQLGYGGEFKLY